MDERKNKITSSQLMTLILSTQIGIGLFSLSSRLAEDAGHDGWIPVVLAGIITTAASILTVLLLKKYGSKSIYEINNLLYGKYLGMVLNIIFILYLIYGATLSIRIFTELIEGMIMKLTPPLVLIPFILLPMLYLSWYGLKSLCRLASLTYIIIAATCVLYFIFIRFIKITFLMPVAEAGLPSIMKGLFTAIFAFYGFELTAVVYPNITDKNKALKYIIGATLISTTFYIITLIIMTGFFGENMLKKIVFPILLLASSYKAPVFERIDMYFLLLWYPAIGLSMTAFFFTAYYSIGRIFSIKRNTLLLFILSAASMLLSRIPKDFVDVNRYLDIYNMMGIAVAYIFPVVCYIFSFINKNGVQE